MQSSSRALVLVWLVIGSVCAKEVHVSLPEDLDGHSGPYLSQAVMKGLFQAVDAKKTGKVSVADLHAFATEMRVRGVANVSAEGSEMRELDTDGDGKVSLQEALAFSDPELEMQEFSAHEKATFKAADKNGDGYLDTVEFTAFKVPEIDKVVEEAYARSVFESKDKDKNGALTLREFNQLSEEEPDGDTQLLHDFEKLDKNGDGTLNLPEVIAWESGRHFTEEALNFVADHADEDKDGHITLAEFLGATPGIEGHDAAHYLEGWAAQLELHDEL